MWKKNEEKNEEGVEIEMIIILMLQQWLSNSFEPK